MTVFAFLCSLAWAGSVSLDFSAAAPARAPLRLGVIAGPTGINGAPDLSAHFREFGIRDVRNNDYYDDRLDLEGILNCGGSTYPSWEGCDATDERYYQWGPSDAMMKTYKDGGLVPMLRLGGEWENHFRKHDFKGPQNAAQERNWIIAATKMAQRYRHQYAYLDIWTEFPGVQFWDRDTREFLPFWVSAYRAIKAAVPEARVGGVGFAVTVTNKLLAGDTNTTVVSLLRLLHKERVRPDWIGWHTFTNNPADYARAGREYRHALEGTGAYSKEPWARDHFFTGVELVLDAFGTTERNGRERLPEALVQDLHAGPQGAAVLAASFISIQTTDTTRGYLYRAGDLAKRGAKRGGSWVGLFGGDPAGTPKKTAHAVRLWANFTKIYPTIQAISQPKGEGPWAALAKGSSGRAIYVANPTNASITLKSVGSIQVESLKSATAYTIDSTQDGLTRSTLPQGAITLPAYGVMLIESP